MPLSGGRGRDSLRQNPRAFCGNRPSATIRAKRRVGVPGVSNLLRGPAVAGPPLKLVSKAQAQHMSRLSIPRYNRVTSKARVQGRQDGGRAV
jgi:hypothetical protein